jgi:hypothetical protein
MSKEERRRKRQEQHQQEVDATVDKLELMEKRGVDIQVTPDGKAVAFVPGTRTPEDAAGWDAKVGAVYEDLQQMHKNEREREIILGAWERFQDEEY